MKHLKPPLSDEEDFDDFFKGLKTLIAANGKNLFYDEVSEIAMGAYRFAYSKMIERRQDKKIDGRRARLAIAKATKGSPC